MSVVIDLESIKLYRADFNEPVEYWDILHCNKTNYSHQWPDRGAKNKAGLFFFHDSIDMSKSCGKELVNQQNKINNSTNQYFYLTSTDATNLKLIDLSNSLSVYLMIDDLKELGINVLSDQIINNTNNKTLLDCFKEPYDAIKYNNDSTQVYEITFTNGKNLEMDKSYFGQLLTDFENGIEFKKMVLDIDNTIDGYRWREDNDPRGLTYCLFDSSKLTEPVRNKIKV